MANLNGFDASTVEPSASFEPIPPGEYMAVITASEMKSTKKGTGKFLELTFQVIEGQHKGRNLWARLNLDNPDPTAVKIARAELSAICRSIGVLTPKDSTELHNLPLTIKVGVKNREDTGDPTNIIKGYTKREAASQPTSPANGKPPWVK